MKKVSVSILLVGGSILIVAGLFLATSLASPSVRSMSRRVGSPAAQLRMQKVLTLSDEGHTALYRKNYALAEKKLRQSLAMDTTGGSVTTWADLGRTLEEQGHFEEAYKAYHEAYDSPARGGYSNFPGDAETLAHYGITCEDNGQHEAAVRAYNKAVDELNPRQTQVSLSVPTDPNETPAPRLRALLGVIRGLTAGEEKSMTGRQDRNGEALEAFQEAAQQQPNDARVQYYLGYGYQQAGQFAAAHSAFQNAAQLDTEGMVKAAAEENLRATSNH